MDSKNIHDGLDYFDCYFLDAYGVTLTEEARNIVDVWERICGPGEVCTAFGIAVEQYESPLEAFDKVGGILYNRNRKMERYFKSLGRGKSHETSF